MEKIIKFIIMLILLDFIWDTQILFSQNKNDFVKGRKYIQEPLKPKNYRPPIDSLVALNLERWKGYKLGLLITWGVYTQWGIIDSWTLCSYDAGWNHRTGPYADDYDTYKKQYEKIQTYFNPVNFNPEPWVTAFKNAGVKYILVMTKHLDGFCMYDTKTTDYSITNDKCPFHTNPRANIANEIANAARNQGLKVGAYFSKADWNNNYFWWRYFGVTWLDVNYNTSVYQEQWNAFKLFTYIQLDEITRNLGKLDILYLDGSWVKPGTNMDIDMPSIAANVRINQPGMLIVDRASGQYEDYLTPEYDIPPEPLGVPWELVSPMSPWWGHVPGIWYYPSDSIVHTLVEVVAKGGNLLLGLGPDKNGVLEPKCYERLQNIGDWMSVNSSAIYETVYHIPFKSENIYFTTKKDTAFAIYLAYNNQQTMPSQISWDNFKPKAGTQVYLLGYPSPLTWSTNLSGVTTVAIPSEIQNNPPCLYAWTFKFIRSDIIHIGNEIPESFFLSQNYPNPFNPATKINFDVPIIRGASGIISLKIYDILGKEIKTLVNEQLQPGKYEITFDGRNFASGTYFYKFSAGNYTETKKMILIK